MNDHELAGHLAGLAGDALVELRVRAFSDGMNEWDLRRQGDLMAHDILVDLLATHRSADSVLSEEGSDDRTRLTAERTWIVDPLDGTRDYPYPDSAEWAVHVALVEQGAVSAAAVSVPSMERLFRTGTGAAQAPAERDTPIVISNRSNTYVAGIVAEALGAQLTACGSAGVKAMLVVGGEVDVYIHASGLYEWDVCAPAGVAAAAGMVVRDMDGREIVYNKPDPVVRGLVIAREEFADTVGAALDW